MIYPRQATTANLSWSAKARSNYRQPWYPVGERYGLIFAYMGPLDRKRHRCRAMPFSRTSATDAGWWPTAIALAPAALTASHATGSRPMRTSWILSTSSSCTALSRRRNSPIRLRNGRMFRGKSPKMASAPFKSECCLTGRVCAGSWSWCCRTCALRGSAERSSGTLLDRFGFRAFDDREHCRSTVAAESNRRTPMTAPDTTPFLYVLKIFWRLTV